MGYKTTRIGQNVAVKFNMDGFDSLLLGVKQRYVTRVGILGSSGRSNTIRKEAGGLAKGGGHVKSKTPASITNAEVGLAHEKGIKSKNLPRRSWLEIPLQEHLGEFFRDLGAKAIATILKNKPKAAYRDLGIIAEQIIQKGFETGGYGKWPKLKPQTVARKKSEAILIDTAQLRRSVTSDVVKK